MSTAQLGTLALGAACGAAVALLLRRALDPAARSAAELAASLGLIPHPEGGFFLETFRAGALPMASRGQTDLHGALMPAPAREGGERNTLTSIYYMLTADSPRQWWANNMSDHVHYWHGGGALTYRVISPDGTLATHTLGPACPQLVVRGGCFKCAELAPGAPFGLLGEAVAPGFDFRDFEFVTLEQLRRLAPAHCAALAHFVKREPEQQFDAYYKSTK
jgi:predicted cupin superfamily sugar epimerase